MNTSKSYTKSSLVAELAKATGLSKAAIGRVLEQLTNVAYREAATGFVVPGLCKIKVVKRKPSRHRNPMTGKLMLIGERLAVKFVPLTKAKSVIVPNKDVSVQIIDDLTPLEMTSAPAVGAPAAAAAAVTAPPPAQAPAAAPAGTVIPDNEEGQIAFPCPECGSMIAAPPSTAGKTGECPFCKASLTIPQRQQGAKPDKQVLSDKPIVKESPTDFVAFICRACGQEIEAPVDMVGMAVDCPTCGTGLHVPLANAPKAAPAKPQAPAPGGKKSDVSSMTIRIDLSDLQ
jgi:nucleoid DNA-binding protein/predicted RNA-binding Zn-ribbon protein involved in translation (DUF1610 family)